MTAPQRDNLPGRVRVAIVADSASLRFGGEAVHPVHTFRLLRQRGFDPVLIVHERTRPELAELFGDLEDVHFVRETWAHKLLWHFGKPLPHSVEYFTLGLISRLLTQLSARRIVRRLAAEKRINVVYHPIPLSPTEPTLFHSLGAPVVIGPLNGGMTYPPALVKRQSLVERCFFPIGRLMVNTLNRLIPGKRRAALILVANERTRRALPTNLQGRVELLVDNGVIPNGWTPSPRRHDGQAKFVYVGRLVGWKAVDLLIEAFAPVARHTGATLDIIGDGDCRAALEQQVKHLGIADSVFFRGWKKQSEIAAAFGELDCMVLPSLYECGGAVVLEAMACSRAVIAARWGGPADYLDDTCGILVEPSTRSDYIAGLTSAMLRLAKDPALCAAMGEAGRKKVVEQYDWEHKIDRLIEAFQREINRSAGEVPARFESKSRELQLNGVS